MRPIKYRGWNPKNEEWIYGYYLQNRGAHFVCPDEFARNKSWDDYEVVPESVGQFTGICECGSYQDGVADDDQLGGTMIYEGDIVLRNDDRQTPYVVVFYECMFGLATIKNYESLESGSHPFSDDYAHLPLLADYPGQRWLTVVGNVYNNPNMDLTTESDKPRVIIIGEEMMQSNMAYYTQLFNGDALSEEDLRKSLLLSATADSPDRYVPAGMEFGISVSEQWPDMCHWFIGSHYGKNAVVFDYMGARKG